MDAKVFQCLVNHIFLPNILPGTSDDIRQIHFLTLINKILNQNEIFNSIKEYLEIKRLFSQWEINQDEIGNIELINESIKNLDEYQSCALYLANQNSTILITHLTKEKNMKYHAVFSVFGVNSKNSEVMSLNGSLISKYPWYSFYVANAETLTSKAFSELLVQLEKEFLEENLRTSTKAGVEMPEVRDVQDPKFVVEWLTSFMSANCQMANYPKQITKKIRDEVVYSSSYKPFRRSGMWISIKVILHLKLIDFFGEKEGLILYKILLINVLEDLCKESFDYTDNDLKMQMIKKLARRIYKFNLIAKPEDLSSFAKQSLDSAYKTIKIIREQINTDLNLKQIKCLGLKYNFDIDKGLKFNKNTIFFKEINRMISISRQEINKTSSLAEKFKRNFLNCAFPDLNLLKVYENPNYKSIIQLFDIENWIISSLDEPLIYSKEFCISLFDLFRKYIGIGLKFYKNDEVGYSRLVLTSMKIVCTLDKIARHLCPLLNEHKIGIESTTIESLLLTGIDHMKCAHKLKEYIEEKSLKNLDPSLVDPDISEKTFSAKFASSDSDIQETKRNICIYIDNKIQEKFTEVEKKRVEYRNILKACPDHEYKLNRVGAYCHNSNNCLLCYASDMKVPTYEKPLPEDETEQNIVVFELRIPILIGVLREAIHSYKNLVLQTFITGSDLHGRWVENTELKQFSNKEVENRNFDFTLGSIRKPFSASHYSSLYKHPNSDLNEFILPNANTLNYCSKGLRKSCYYKQTGFENNCIHKANPPYHILQWTINSTHHSENEVIARQSECPRGLDLNEFINFGCFRAGQNLQLKNLLVALETRSLSFSEKGVYSLIAQSLWEIGQQNKTNEENLSFYRFINLGSHADLYNDVYLNNLNGVLDEFIEVYSKKWDEHIVLLIIVIILNRVIQFSSQKNWGSKLRKCKAIANDWVTQIERIIENSNSLNKDERFKLKEKLYQVLCILILTHNVDRNGFKFVMNEKEDVLIWLDSMYKINNFNSIYGITPADAFSENLKRSVDICMVNIEDEFNRIVIENEFRPLNHFLNSKWSDAKKGKIQNWIKDTCTFKASHIQDSQIIRSIEIGINGLFLIDNIPVGRLPNKILEHQLYVDYFKTTSFEVFPSVSNNNEFITKYLGEENNASSFSFRLINNELLIKERRADTEFLLIPNQIFENEFPIYFADNFSHWLDLNKNRIEFRNKSFSENFKKKFYIFDLNEQIFYEVNGKEYEIKKFFYNKSKEFTLIKNRCTNSLELDKHVHAFIQDKKITIELKRFNISFTYELHTNEFYLNEFHDMLISNDQRLDTLIGLVKGLVLTNKDKSKQKLIVPHAKIFINENSLVDIELENLKEPAYFSYDIDFKLKRLMASESKTAWLHLACLHGYTAQVLPDPFLNLTGTEMALDILQSGYCWSCKPYETNDLEILENIAALSPKREFYPRNKEEMQTVRWPKGISSLAAHDAFRFIVEKLIYDSERIKWAFNKTIEVEEEKREEKKKRDFLAIRAYNRYKNNYTPFGRVGPDFEGLFLGKKNQKLKVNYFCKSDTDKIEKVRIISSDDYATYIKNKPYDFINWFYNREERDLVGVSDEWNLILSINSWISISENFHDNWLNLFDFARGIGNNKEKQILFKMFLSFCAYQSDIPLIPLAILRSVSENNKQFISLNPILYNVYYCFKTLEYKNTDIIQTLESNFIDINQFKKKGNYLLSYSNNVIDTLYKNKKNEVMSELEKYYSLFKDTLVFNPADPDLLSYFLPKLEKEIKTLFKIWTLNKGLRNFFDRLCSNFNLFLLLLPLKPLKLRNFKNRYQNKSKTILNADIVFDLKSRKLNENEENLLHEAELLFLTGRLDDTQMNMKIDTSENFENNPKFPFDIQKTNCDLTRDYLLDLKKSWNKNLKLNKTKLIANVSEKDLEQEKNLIKNKEKAYLAILNYLFGPINETDAALNNADLWPRIVLIKLLKYLINRPEKQIKLDSRTKNVIGSIGVLMTLEQRVQKCIKYKEGEDLNELSKELLNTPHENWSPKKKPHWLLFEIESNLTIRTIQVRVANKMINPPQNKNTCMQLNMGEGKTSVITPLIITSLTNGKNLVRVIVLNSLLNVNYSSLVQKLGGLLNKRVYIFPCDRDIQFDDRNISAYESLYNECIDKKGVVITLPEYILSFKLKGIDMIHKNKESLSISLLKVQKLLETNSRDILDESDEILNVMYQLVYSSGKYSTVAGGQTRWLFAQEILLMARKHFDSIKNIYKDECVELNARKAHAYPMFRLVNEKPFPELCEKILQDYFDCYPLIKNNQKNSIRNFVLNEEIAECDRKVFDELNNTDLKNKILLLRGYFAFNLLYHVFNKSYKVDYGVNFKTQRLLQAVPYRAKDVPAERAQFSHSDVYILLTILNYYYEGIRIDQFKQLLLALDKKHDKNQIYEEWTKEINKKINFPNSLKDYCSINLSDTNQINELFRYFCIYPPVINFWMNNFLFPIEAREFDEQLGTSAWDLCNAKHKPKTGFSGTNDSKYLLPANMSYISLPELRSTNGSLLHNLLKEENNFYYFLKQLDKLTEILNKINNISNCNLLLDVGALMVNISNEGLSKEWLKMNKSAEAAVYFDADNNLRVVNREGKIFNYELSPYKNNLKGCLIYLDEYHTRGTDLKIPKGTIGAVTLGKNVTKDKLMQACMRMRMLGNGHSVRFLASNEVHNQIKANCASKKIGSFDVIKWAIEKSRDQIVNGFIFWGLQGISYYKRQAAYENYLRDSNTKEYFTFYKDSKDNSLNKLYEKNRKKTSINNIILANFEWQTKQFPMDFNQLELENDTNIILAKIECFVRNEVRFANLLEDEQEIELENEKEEEQELHRPKKVLASAPRLENDVVDFMKNGKFNHSSDCFIHMPKSFAKTSACNIMQEFAWSENLFVTKDFVRTVEYHTDDDYLKIPRWVVGSPEKKIIFISAHELNQFINEYNEDFKASELKFCVFMARKRQDQKRLFNLNKNSINISNFYIEQLGIYSGSLFLLDKSELEAYLSFLGYFPRPRSNKEEGLVEKGHILSSGFVENKKAREELGLISCKFIQDPMEMVRIIAEIRNHGLVPESAHHLFIIKFGKRPF